MESSLCPECGAKLEKGKSCRDYFNQMLVWDFEDFSGAGSVHHLTVLCYHLQHPSLYSPVALNAAKIFLKSIIENNLTAHELLEQNRQDLSKQKKNFSIKGTTNSHATYLRPIIWSMTVINVVEDGI